jgi:lactate dehydrogenase-like 2-hydroxyacid dehydrogenase
MFNDNTTLIFGTGNSAKFFHNGVNLHLDLLDTSNHLVIRDTTTNRFTFARTTGDFTATGNITAFSDKRIKKNIEPITESLAKVLTLNGVTFDRTDIKTTRQTGIIAQEVQAVLPEAVTETDSGIMTVAYGNMVGLLIEAIKELTHKVNTLEARL